MREALGRRRVGRDALKKWSSLMPVKPKVERAVSEAEDQGLEALKGVREVRDNMADALDQSVKRRPYTTLLLAVGLGFLLGAVWAR
jgi:ElaB/YqjD/DUF883 family membrane-anchored ribosome-binding protein